MDSDDHWDSATAVNPKSEGHVDDPKHQQVSRAAIPTVQPPGKRVTWGFEGSGVSSPVPSRGVPARRGLGLPRLVLGLHSPLLVAAGVSVRLASRVSKM